MGKKKVFWPIISLALVYFAVFPVFAAETGNLKVYVLDCETEELIIGAYVNIIHNNTGWEKQTNKYGYVYFSGLEPGKYDFSALAEGYISNHKETNVYEGRTTNTEICLEEETSEDIEVEIENLKIDPDIICIDEDKNIDIYLNIELEEGNNVDFKVKFYLYDDGDWDYIGSDKETLEEDERKKFKIIYKYKANTLEEDNYEIKAEIEYNDEEETEYNFFWVRNCTEIVSNFEIGAIKFDPVYPKIDEMVIASVPIKLVEGSGESVEVEAWIDGRLQKSEDMNFDYLGQTKSFEFAFDTSGYGIGYHKIKIIIKTNGKTQETEKDFYISKERYEAEEYQRKHCLRIKEIKELNPFLKSGDKAEISLEIENCGDYTERNINLKLENSEMIQKPSFNLAQGEEKEFLFEFNISEKENLTISAWNGYNSVSEKYNLVVYSGILSIHLKPEYVIYANEDNKIKFSLRNIGKVDDEFGLQVSENVVGWITELPDKIEIGEGESKDIEIIVNPNVVAGIYEFNITSKTAGSENIVTSGFKVKERWKFPTGDIIFTRDILSWIFLILLIVPILLLFYLVSIYLHSRYEKSGKEETPTRVYLQEEKPTRRGG